MAPFPQDSDDDPEDMYALNDEDDDEYIPEDMENAIVLDDNDAPGIDEALEDLDFEDEDPEEIENGFIPDDSMSIFQKHDGSVFCVAVSPCNKDIMVSGGEDDKGFIINMKSNESLVELGNHKDSVISCGFNSDGKYVMTADMSGTIKVRTVENGSDVWDFDCGDIEWCKWHSIAPVIFAGTAEGDVYMWKIPSGDCKIYHTHGSKSTSSSLSASAKELFTGYEDGSVKLWDLKAGSAIFHSEENKEDPVICVASQNTGKVFACGTKSGSIKLFSETGKLLVTFQSSVESEEASIECIEFSKDGHFLATGSLDNKLCIWDLTTQRTRHECKHPAGVSHIAWLSSEGNKILTASVDGTLRLWDTGSGELTRELQGHRGHILDVFVFNEDKNVLTAGDDETSRIFML